MANQDFLIRMADWSLFVYLILLVGVGLWAIRGMLPKEVRAKYGRPLIFTSQLPFAYRWRRAISTEDLPAFESARFRQLILIAAICTGSLVISFYGFINSVALLHRCSIERMGPQ